jgi:NAD-dependent deacetylase
MPTIPDKLHEILRRLAASESGTLVVLSGAGISAESGIPTFRGKEGYWTVGSHEYQPEEMATLAMFSVQPEEVWSWYLYRRGVCRAAEPNAGHRAVVRLEELLGERFLLITQNVDGLHLRAGSSPARTYQIHGNIDFMRCARECGAPFAPLPELPRKGKGEALTDEERAALRCARCGGPTRPHVLWFDECYDEEHFRFHSSLRAATEASVLVVVGTSGATNLPMQVGQAALYSGAAIVDINPEPNPFSALASRAERGFYLQGSASSYLPLLADAISACRPS